MIQVLANKESSPYVSVLANARRAQAEWSKKPVRVRLRFLQKLRYEIAKHDYRLAEAASKNGQRQLSEVLASEVLPLADSIGFLEHEASQLLRVRKLGAKNRPLWLSGEWTEVRREPFGIVFIIGPVNYPLFLPGCQLVQALAAGNATVVKPGDDGSEVLQLLHQLIVRVGMDPDLLTILPEDKNVVTEILNIGIDKIILTGSAEAGKAILPVAAELGTPSVAELSGCDAAFILPGANLDLVSKALAFSLRWNKGETCIAPRRVFVAKENYQELKQRLVETVQPLQKDWQPSETSAKAVPHIQEALSQGANLLTGKIIGQKGITPTILVDVNAEMTLAKTDIFAPVLSLVPVDIVQEALRESSKCPFALGSSVFGPEPQAKELAEKINAGIVLVNDIIVPTADPRIPFSGRDKSGFGVTRGAEGLLELTRLKVVAHRKGHWYHLLPPKQDDADFFHRYLQASHGPNWWSRFKNWTSFLGFLTRRFFKN